MKIKKLTVSDVDRFKSIRIIAVEDFPASFYPTKNELIETSDEDFRTQLTPSDWSTIFGAFEKDELIGIVGIKRDKRMKVKHKADIWGMYVKQSDRGRGIARQLMKSAIDHVAAFPEVIAITLSVNSGNAAARSLYVSIGFRPFGLEKNSIFTNGNFIHEEHMMLDLTSKEGSLEDLQTSKSG